MSLCFSTLIGSGLIVSSDGVAGNRNNEIIHKDQPKLFKITDNLIIFVSGNLGGNLEVIEIIQNIEDKSVFDDIDTIERALVDACKTVWERHQDKWFVQSWLIAQTFNLNNDDSNIFAAIPICLSAFYYDKKVQAYFYMSLSPEDDFKPETFNMGFGQTLVKGFRSSKALSLLKKYQDSMSPVKSTQSEIEKFEKVFRYLEREEPHAIGGITTYYLMGFNETKIVAQGGTK